MKKKRDKKVYPGGVEVGLSIDEHDKPDSPDKNTAVKVTVNFDKLMENLQRTARKKLGEKKKLPP